MNIRTLRRSACRSGAVLATTLAFATAGLALAPAAQAMDLTVETGSLSFSGDTGDWVTGGNSYAYSTAAQDRLGVYGSTDNGLVRVSVNAADGAWWTLDLAAPSGTPLAPGTYTGATASGSNGPTEPGLSLSGNGKGCSTLTGSFTVQDVEFGPQGYVQKLDATYEQHCSGAEAALRGEVHIAN
ncbi:hypothetical protein GUY60_37275, partial [Streptomyces sp. YC537]|nr:hypothetical protein [Streptomyces boluensis]